MSDPRIETALAYHERTKHRFPDRYARALGYLDWATQPDPFRTYEGAPRLLLDEIEVGTGYEASWGEVRAGSVSPAPLGARAIAQFFYDALAISAWKRAGRSTWALRCNPSSGNLHPTEGYLLCPPIDAIAAHPALFHDSPRDHALELRRAIDSDAWRALAARLPEGSIAVGLTSIVWREAWKYGERAFRYCMHDVGHAIGAIAIAARILGWRVRLVEGLDHDALARLLSVADQVGPEAERPDLLLAIETRPTAMHGAISLDGLDVAPLCAAAPIGRPNRLSREHHAWPILDEIERATRDDGRKRGDGPAAAEPLCARTFACDASARALVRRRRSAVDMDATTSISRDALFAIARSLVPALAPALHPLPWRPRVHPVFFLHRIEGLEPGLAVLARDPDALADLRAAIALADEWAPLPGQPEDLPLFRIARGDVRALARACSCHQDIAADGAFAVAMLARFEPTLREEGAHAYRELHWEAGLLGQILYLEAEAHDVSGTGIGCFFDDAIHELLGLRDRRFQSIYSFTVGGAVHDPRIQSLPAYHHRRSPM